MSASPLSETAQPGLDGIRSSFVVGQNQAGYWIAVETHGLGGGFFRSRKDAIRYALGQTVGRPDAVTLTADPITIQM